MTDNFRKRNLSVMPYLRNMCHGDGEHHCCCHQLEDCAEPQPEKETPSD